MGVGDLSFAAVASLRSIDSWIATINSNMAGSAKVGYKATRVKFNGGTTTSERPVVSPRLGVSVAEQSLGIAQTSIDFSQGTVAASTENTHLAIQRTSAAPGVFVLSNVPDPANPPAGVTAETYYSFDGEFHYDTQGRLVNAAGLYVLSTDGDAMGVDAGDVVNDQLALDRLQIQVVPNPQLTLEFSRFGSSIFEQIPGSVLPAVVTPDAIGNYNDAGNGAGRVIPSALEASNASLTQSTPELALAQKLYQALAKVIQVALSNIDTALQLGPR